MKKLLLFLLLLPAFIQAQVKISDLPYFGTSAENAYVPATIGAATYKVFGKQLAAGKLDSIQIISLAYPAPDSLYEWKAGVRKYKGLLTKAIDTSRFGRREVYTIRTLPTIGADANYFMPTPTDTTFEGRILVLNNANTSAFVYTLTGATVKEADGTTISTLPNATLGFYLWNGTAWVRLSTGGGTGGAPDPYLSGFCIIIDPVTKEISVDSTCKQEITLIRAGDSLAIVVGTDTTSKVYAPITGGGSGSPNSNIGAGYRWVIPGTNNVKTVFPGYGQLIDSTSNTDALTFKSDTATLFPAIRATIPAGGSGGGSSTNIYVQQNGVLGDTLGGVLNDSTIILHKIRDSGYIEISYAPDGALVIYSAGNSNSIVQGGNSFGATMVIGTNDANKLIFEINNAEKAGVNATGVLYQGVSTSIGAGMTKGLYVTDTLVAASGINFAGSTPGTMTGFSGSATAFLMKAGGSTILTASNATTGSTFAYSRTNTLLSGSLNVWNAVHRPSPTSASTAILTGFRSTFNYPAGVDTANSANLTGRYIGFYAEETFLVRHIPGNDRVVGFASDAGNNYFHIPKANTIGVPGSGFGHAIGTALTDRVDITSSTGYTQLRLRTTYTPSASADANGAVGSVAWDDSYIYIKVSTGWKRTALSTF